MLILGLLLGVSESLQHSLLPGLLLNDRLAVALLLHLVGELSADIAVEGPQINAVLVTGAHDSGVVRRAEHDRLHGVGVPDERLVEVGESLLRFIVPDLEHSVFASG